MVRDPRAIPAKPVGKHHRNARGEFGSGDSLVADQGVCALRLGFGGARRDSANASRRCAIAGHALGGCAFPTDFAEFIRWRDAVADLFFLVAVHGDPDHGWFAIAQSCARVGRSGKYANRSIGSGTWPLETCRAGAPTREFMAHRADHGDAQLGFGDRFSEHLHGQRKVLPRPGRRGQCFVGILPEGSATIDADLAQ